MIWCWWLVNESRIHFFSLIQTTSNSAKISKANFFFTFKSIFSITSFNHSWIILDLHSHCFWIANIYETRRMCVFFQISKSISKKDFISLSISSFSEFCFPNLGLVPTRIYWSSSINPSSFVSYRIYSKHSSEHNTPTITHMPVIAFLSLSIFSISLSLCNIICSS